MKRIKRIALLPMLLALLFALTACGLTPEKVLQKTEAAMAEQPLSGFHAAMEADVSVNVAGTVTEVKMSLGADILFSPETFSLYADVDIVYNDVAQSMQLYHLMENGKSTLYVYDPANDLWSRSALDITPPAGTPEGTQQNGLDSSLFTLTEDVALPDGTTAHQLSCTIDATMAEDYEEAAAELGKQFGMDNLDLSQMRIPMNLFVDTETFLPVKAELSIEGLNETIAPILSTLLGASGEGIEFNMGDIKLSLTKLRFGEQTVPQLPKDAPLRVDILTHTPDMGDGTYVIKSIYDAVRITCPKGWTVGETSYFYLPLMRNDGYRAINFITQEKSKPTDSGLYTVSAVLEQLKQNGTYHSDERGEKQGDYELAWIRDTNGIFYAYGWKHLSDNTLLLIEVLDGTGTYNAKTLISAAAEMVEPYPVP